MKNNWEEKVNLSSGLSPNRLHIHGSNHFTPCGMYFSNIVAETQSKEESTEDKTISEISHALKQFEL